MPKWPLPHGTKIFLDIEPRPYIVRGYVDGMVIVRSWAPDNKSYSYEIKTQYWVELWLREGRSRVELPPKTKKESSS